MKIPVADLAAVRLRLSRVGGRRITRSEFEANVLFDGDDGGLAATDRVLRLRRVGSRSLLTFKGPAEMRGPVKVRNEIELDITSAEDMTELLGALGFAPSVRYEKWRERWKMGEVEVDLDRTPMGDFVELEGAADILEDIAVELHLDPSDAVEGSYLELWRQHCRTRPGLGPDMVFE
jgi:adenylate cyclase class 2